MGWSDLDLQYCHLHPSWHPQISDPHGANGQCLRQEAPKQGLEQVLNHYLILPFFSFLPFFRGKNLQCTRFSNSIVTCQPHFIHNNILMNVILYLTKKIHLCYSFIHFNSPISIFTFFSYFYIHFISLYNFGLIAFLFMIFFFNLIPYFECY